VDQWCCQKGNTLLIPCGSDPGQKHLFALLISPVVVDGYGHSPMVLLANVTSVKNGVAGDDACLLSEGEHPFITHDSFVDYRLARFEKADFIATKVKNGGFTEKEPCSPVLIRKIIQGALASRKIPREYKKILQGVLFG
jgi:hypothetical protein